MEESGRLRSPWGCKELDMTARLSQHQVCRKPYTRACWSPCVTLRPVPQERNDLEKSDTSEAKLGLSALGLAVRNWKMARSKKLRSLPQGDV